MNRSLVWASLFPVVSILAQAPVFRSGVSMVEVDAQVVGKAGVIDGLRVEDFVVTDNRKPVALRYCAQDDLPLDIVFLFELSKDMAPRQSNLVLASEVAMAELREGDRAAVLSFNDRVRPEQSLTPDLNEMKRRLRLGLANTTFGRRPVILPSVEASVKYLPPQTEQRRQRAILMFTGDAGFGLKNQNHMSVSKDFWEADVILSALVIPTTLTKLTHDDNPAHFDALTNKLGFNLFDYVDEVAEQTGGEMVYAGDAGSVRHDPNPNAALRKMIQRMRKRYKLYYDMPPGRAGQRRRIDVELSAGAQKLYPDARVIRRRGYVVPKPMAE